MPATPIQKQNQYKRATYSFESFKRAQDLVKRAKDCPCRACVGAADLAITGAEQAATDARLWEGRLYGSERRYPYTLRLKSLSDLRDSLPYPTN